MYTNTMLSDEEKLDVIRQRAAVQELYYQHLAGEQPTQSAPTRPTNVRAHAADSLSDEEKLKILQQRQAVQQLYYDHVAGRQTAPPMASSRDAKAVPNAKPSSNLSPDLNVRTRDSLSDEEKLDVLRQRLAVQQLYYDHVAGHRTTPPVASNGVVETVAEVAPCSHWSPDRSFGVYTPDLLSYEEKLDVLRQRQAVQQFNSAARHQRAQPMASPETVGAVAERKRAVKYQTAPPMVSHWGANPNAVPFEPNAVPFEDHPMPVASRRGARCQTAPPMVSYGVNEAVAEGSCATRYQTASQTVVEAFAEGRQSSQKNHNFRVHPGDSLSDEEKLDVIRQRIAVQQLYYQHVAQKQQEPFVASNGVVGSVAEVRPSLHSGMPSEDCWLHSGVDRDFRIHPTDTISHEEKLDVIQQRVALQQLYNQYVAEQHAVSPSVIDHVEALQFQHPIQVVDPTPSVSIDESSLYAQGWFLPAGVM